MTKQHTSDRNIVICMLLGASRVQ